MNFHQVSQGWEIRFPCNGIASIEPRPHPPQPPPPLSSLWVAASCNAAQAGVRDDLGPGHQAVTLVHPGYVYVTTDMCVLAICRLREVPPPSSTKCVKGNLKSPPWLPLKWKVAGEPFKRKIL